MRISFPALLRFVVFPLLTAALFAGCCGSVACNCQSYRADALLFNFSPGSFTAAEIDTIILVRSVYPRDTVTNTATTRTYAKPDSVVVVRPQATAFSTPLVIDNTEPFASVNGRKVGYANPDSSYRYTIVVREPARHRRALVLARYYIGRVELRGQYEADGCCSCYRNEVKQYTLSSQPLGGTRRDTLVDAHTAPGVEPKVVVLRR